jgi:hypothetical protein
MNPFLLETNAYQVNVVKKHFIPLKVLYKLWFYSEITDKKVAKSCLFFIKLIVIHFDLFVN